MSHITKDDLLKENEELRKELAAIRKKYDRLKRSEAFYRSAFDFSPDGILIEDDKGIILDVNPAFLKNYGYTKKDILGKPVYIVAQDESREDVDNNIQRLLAGEELQFVVKSRKKNGDYIYTELNEKSIKLPDGRTGIISISRNKTEQIQAQQALKNSEKEFRNLIKLLPYGVIIYNMEAKAIYANREMAKIFKAEKPEELIGKSVFDYIQKNTITKVKNRFEKLLKGQRLPATRERAYDFQGNTLELEVISRRTIFNGKPALLAIVVDISEKIRAERRLRQTEAFYRKLFENAPHPEIIQSGGKIIAINRSAVKFLQLDKAEDLIGKPVKKLVSPQTPLENLELTDGKQTRTYRNIVIQTRQNNERITDITAARTYYAGRPAVQLVFYDVTELYQTINKLKESEETYRELFDKSSEAIYVQDKDGVFLDVNRGVINMYGYPKKFFIGNSPLPLSAPGMNDLEKVGEHLKKAFEGEPQQFEFWGKRKNGEIFPKIVRLNRGKYFGKDIIFAFAMDISEQKKVEMALIKSNKALELMNAVSQIGISSRSPEDLAEKLAYELRKNFTVDAFILDGFYPGTTRYYGFGNFDTIDGKFQKVLQFDHNFDWQKSDKRKKLFNEKRPVFILRNRGQVKRMIVSRRKKNIIDRPSASLIYIPLVLGNKVTGVLSIQSYEYNAYTREDVELLNRVGIQIAPAIESLMLNKELMDQSVKLRENEIRYRLLFDHAMDYILIIDPFHKQGPTIVDANEAAFRVHGYTRSELIGMPLSGLDDGKNRNAMKARLQRILAKEAIKFETTHVRKDGTRFDVEVNAQLIELNGKQYIYALERDISERKIAEEALKASEKKYKQLVDNSLTGIYIVQNFILRFCNRQFAEMFGYKDPKELIGINLKKLVAPESLQKVTKEVRLRETAKKQTARYEFRAVRKDGQIIDVEVLGTLISLDGKPAIQGTIIDMTERKRAERSIHRLATVVEQSVEAIEITDLDGHIQYVNRAQEEICGYSRSELIGESTRIHKSGKHDRQFYQDLWSTILSGKRWQGVFLNKRKNGTIYYEKAVIFPIKDSSDKIINFAAVRRDITMERKLEQQLQQMQKMEAIGTLTGGIAHDFNNLLTVINGHAEIGLMRVAENDRVHSDLLSILNAGKRAERLTSQLLAFSRKQIHELKILQINDVIRDLKKMLQRLIPENIRITTSLGKDLPFIKADPAQIEQILINLVVNARDALMDQTNGTVPKKIDIMTKSVDIDDYMVKQQVGVPTGVYIVLSVRDTGVGIEEDIKDRIFEPFFTTKEVNKGTGLGLSTVYGIVKQNNGYIFVESEKGKGSTFSIFWPVTFEQPEPELASKIIKENLRGKESILFIEDDEAVRSFACQALRNFGYTIYEAVNGKNAIKLIDSEKLDIDFVISDLIMPEMDGRELGREIGKRFPSIKILYVSGYAHDHLVKDGVFEPGVNFLQKPYSIQDLLKMIRKMLKAE